MEAESVSSRERIAEMTLRRRRNRFLRSLFLFVVVAAAFTAVVVGGWGKFRRTSAYKALTGTEEKPPEETVEADLLPDGGFHVVGTDYWVVFDEAASSEDGRIEQPLPPADRPGDGGDPSSGSGTPAVPPREDRVSAEGLRVHAMEDTGPYSVNGDMGGLIAARVGVWKSPNRLGNGPIAFYCEHLEEVTVTHWAKNLLGFRVYRVVKEGRAGWTLGASLLDDSGEPLR